MSLKSQNLKSHNFIPLDESFPASNNATAAPKPTSSAKKSPIQSNGFIGLKTDELSESEKLMLDMNKTERGYYLHLKELERNGFIRRVDFECEKLKLARSTYYTPDFRVIKLSGEVEFHETKGFWRDDARVKIKVAATLHPYKFFIIKKIKGGWSSELVKI